MGRAVGEGMDKNKVKSPMCMKIPQISVPLCLYVLT